MGHLCNMKVIPGAKNSAMGNLQVWKPLESGVLSSSCKCVMLLDGEELVFHEYYMRVRLIVMPLSCCVHAIKICRYRIRNDLYEADIEALGLSIFWTHSVPLLPLNWIQMTSSHFDTSCSDA